MLKTNAIQSNTNTGVSIKPVISLDELRATTSEHCHPDNIMRTLIAGVLADWYWSDSSTSSDDGLGVIKATAIATGRWLKGSADIQLDAYATKVNVQNNDCTYADAAGSTTAYTASYTPAITVLTDGMTLSADISAIGTNTTTIPSFAVNGLPAKTIVNYDGSALKVGDLPTRPSLQYSTALTAWILLNPSISNIFDTKFYEPSIKTIGGTVNANALTITSAAQNINFRSSTLSNGTIYNRSMSATSLVVPSAVTLGTINSQQSRLAVLAIDNAGTPELAVTNIRAGVNLDETTLISTNAIATVATGTGVIAVTTGILTISGSPTGTWQVGQIVQGTNVPAGTYITALGTGTGGAGTYQTNITTAVSSTAMTGCAGMGVYSATARSNLPFRVLGFVESTQATAGTWATAPSTVQGCGGEAMSAWGSLGVGQTWQQLLSSRAKGTTYYNTTGRPILVAVSQIDSAGGIEFYVNGVLLYYSGSGSSGSNFCTTVVVPSGASYSLKNTSGTLYLWNELR